MTDHAWALLLKATFFASVGAPALAGLTPPLVNLLVLWRFNKRMEKNSRA